MNRKAQLYILSACFLIIPLLLGPWFTNYFRTPKWVFLYAISLILLVTSRNIPIPEIKIKKITGVFFALVGCGIIFHSHAPWSPLILDTLCFLVLTLTTYSLALNHRKKLFALLSTFNLLASAIVLFISYFQLFKIPLFYPFNLFPQDHLFYFTSFFGNPIFIGEFLAASFLIMLLNIELGGAKGKKVLSHILMAASLLMIYLLFSRLVMLGLLLAYVIPRVGKLNYRWLLGGIGLVILTSTLIGKNPFTSDYWLEKKAESVSGRSALILNSLAMIKERPFFGVGPGRFPISYVPFAKKVKIDPWVQEYRFRDDPHSGPIRMAVEFGLPITLMFLFFCFKLFLFLIKNNQGPISRFLLGSYVFISIDFIFGFPWKLPYPFLFIAFCTGLGLSLFLPAKKRPFSHGKIIIPIFFILLGYRGVSYSMAHFYVKNNPNDWGKMSFACKVLPSFWKGCYNQVKLANRYGKYNELLTISGKMIKTYPGHSAFLRASGLAHQKRNENSKACKQFAEYVEIMGKSNRVYEIKKALCN